MLKSSLERNRDCDNGWQAVTRCHCGLLAIENGNPSTGRSDASGQYVLIYLNQETGLLSVITKSL